MPSMHATIATDVLLHALKNFPFGIGTAVDLFDTINNSVNKYYTNQKFERIHNDINHIQKLLVHILVNLNSPNLSGSELERQFRAIQQIRAGGWEPTLFAGLLRNSIHWEDLKRRPNIYGDVLENTTVLDSEKIRVIIDLDNKRVLELTPFAVSRILSDQVRGVPKARVEAGQDIWAFPSNEPPNGDDKKTMTGFWRKFLDGFTGGVVGDREKSEAHPVMEGGADANAPARGEPKREITPTKDVAKTDSWSAEDHLSSLGVLSNGRRRL